MKINEKMVSLGIPSFYTPYRGSFTVNMDVSSRGQWYTCRESFHHYRAAGKKDGLPFLYSMSVVQDLDSVVDTFNDVEKKLGLSEADQCEVTKTDVPHIVLFSPSEWWSDPIRFNLLSALLKGANPKGLSGARNNYSYLLETAMTLDKFLDGHTFYQGLRFTGWYKEFCGVVASKALADKPAPNKTVTVTYGSGWQEYELKLMQR